MPYEVQKDESLSAALKRIAEEQLTGAIQDLQNAEDPDTSIYEARKRIKKVRSILRLIQPQIGPVYQEMNRRLRDVARSFSDLRDSKVSLELLNDFAKQYRRKTTLNRHCQALVSKQSALKSSATFATNLAESVNTLIALRKRIEDWPLHDISGSMIHAEMKKTHRQGRHAYEVAKKTRTPEDFHELRKLVKRELNQIRLFDSTGSDDLKQLSTLLGDHHNLAVLQHNVDTPSARFLQMLHRQMRPLETEILAIAQTTYNTKQKSTAA